MLKTSPDIPMSGAPDPRLALVLALAAVAGLGLIMFLIGRARRVRT